MPEPVRGGRVIVHLANLPKNVNYVVENSAVAHRMLYEIHEFLVQRDFETWEHRPVLASSWDTEDSVILKPEAAGTYPAAMVGQYDAGKRPILYGQVREEGEEYVVTPVSPGSRLPEPVRVAKGDVVSVEPGTVFTFRLRKGVKWHDGHPFDANDVLFSFTSYLNPAVDCDAVRFAFQKFTHVEVVDPLTVRFIYEKRYFGAIDAFTNLCVMPSHLFNLSDRENPKYNPRATQAEQGKFINEHPNNTMWVGLGPYRVTEWSNQYIEARRFPDYFDPPHGGYVDTIRWRLIVNDDAAVQALLNGELDYYDRLRTEDYFGTLTEKPEYTSRLYKGYFYTPRMGYVSWNLRRPLFEDVRVRRALAHGFDWDALIASVYQGLAVRVTGVAFYLGPGYNHDVEPIPYDLAKAEALLAEAGWYDRDGDGVIDKDGRRFQFEFLMPTGNKASETIGLRLQESYAKLGIKVNIATREWASFNERMQDHDFDCVSLAWVLDVENDPQQLWDSALADKRSSNHAGLRDAKVDALLVRYAQELDPARRAAVSRELHARIYELQPYMFGLMSPVKFTMARRVRNFQCFGIDPGYSIRRWYIVEPAR